MQAQGVHCKIKNNYLGFKKSLQDKPPTRKGALSTITPLYNLLGIAAPFVLAGQVFYGKSVNPKLIGMRKYQKIHIKTGFVGKMKLQN